MNTKASKTLNRSPEVQVVAVCDPEKYSENYLEFVSKEGLKSIRRLLEKPAWGAKQFSRNIPHLF